MTGMISRGEDLLQASFFTNYSAESGIKHQKLINQLIINFRSVRV